MTRTYILYICFLYTYLGSFISVILFKFSLAVGIILVICNGSYSETELAVQGFLSSGAWNMDKAMAMLSASVLAWSAALCGSCSYLRVNISCWIALIAPRSPLWCWACLWSPGYSGTCSADQAGPKLRDSPACSFRMLILKCVCHKAWLSPLGFIPLYRSLVNDICAQNLQATDI